MSIAYIVAKKERQADGQCFKHAKKNDNPRNTLKSSETKSKARQQKTKREAERRQKEK